MDIMSGVGNLISRLQTMLLSVFGYSSAIYGNDSTVADVMSTAFDIGGRTVLEIWVSTNVASTFGIYGLTTVTGTPRLVDSIVFGAGGGSLHKGYRNAYRYIYIANAAVGNHEVEIASSGR